MTVASSGSTPTPFGFAGQHGYQTDTESGLMRLGHRYYDASTGRFISRDPIRAGYNWYVYCDNDPINAVDPEGLDWKEDARKILGAINIGLGLIGAGAQPFQPPGSVQEQPPSQSGQPLPGTGDSKKGKPGAGASPGGSGNGDGSGDAKRSAAEGLANGLIITGVALIAIGLAPETGGLSLAAGGVIIIGIIPPRKGRPLRG